MKETILIAEIGQAHEGSLGLLHSMIIASAKAGANAIKFQIHVAKHESTYDEPFRVKGSGQDASRYEYWKRMEFSELQWKECADLAHHHGCKVIISPFSLEAFSMAERIGCDIIKIGSGEVHNINLINQAFETKLPLIISTGLISNSKLDELVKRSKLLSNKAIFLHCVSEYPTTPNRSNLQAIDYYHERYGIIFGLSDHSGTIYPSLYAISNNLPYVEVHVSFSREMYGFDSSSSITFGELKQLSDYKDFIRKALMPIDEINKEYKSKMEKIFSRSIALKHEHPKDYVIKSTDICLKKPGGFISPDKVDQVIGKSLTKDYDKMYVLRWSDLKS